MSAVWQSRHVCCVTQQTCLLCRRARHVCCVAEQACPLCDTSDMSAVSQSRHVCYDHIYGSFPLCFFTLTSPCRFQQVLCAHSLHVKRAMCSLYVLFVGFSQCCVRDCLSDVHCVCVLYVLGFGLCHLQVLIHALYSLQSRTSSLGRM